MSVVPVAAALITQKSEVRIEDVLVNPLRLGFFETLLEMGASISYEERRDPIDEPIATKGPSQKFSKTAQLSSSHRPIVPSAKSPPDSPCPE